MDKCTGGTPESVRPRYPPNAGKCWRCGSDRTWDVKHRNPYNGKWLPSHIDAEGYITGDGECPEFATQSRVNAVVGPDQADPEVEPELTPKLDLVDMSLKATVENEIKRPCPARCGEYKCPINGCDCWSGSIIVLEDLTDVICVPCLLKEITGQLDRINEALNDDDV
jgi:hypothetical protein